MVCKNTRFFLVGYEDSEIISLSSSKLPFQEGAREASWWSEV